MYQENAQILLPIFPPGCAGELGLADTFYLINALQEIVVGFRVPAGYVLRTQNFKTIELPRLVRGKPHAWDPFLCMNWADSFLDHLKKHVPNQEAKHKKRDVWRVKFTPGTGVVLKQLDEAGVAEVENGEERFGFLPNWYFDELRLMSASSTTWTIR